MRRIKKTAAFLLCIVMMICMAGCGETEITRQEQTRPSEPMQEETQKAKEMKLYFNEEAIPVSWEDNAAVKQLKTEAETGDIVVNMSMYSDNEQVGSLGKNYPSDDTQMTTNNGDIVLYNSSNIVVFYGSNTWAYTKIGKIELPEDKIKELLSNGDIQLTICIR